MDPKELKLLKESANQIFYSNGSKRIISSIEKITAKFAFSSVVSIKDIIPGEKFSEKNIWVKRPGTGYFKASQFDKILGKKAKRFIPKDNFIKRSDV